MAGAGAEQRGGPHRVRHARAHRARQGELHTRIRGYLPLFLSNSRHNLLRKLNGRKNYLRKKTFIEKIYHTVNRLRSFLSSSHFGHLGQSGHLGHLGLSCLSHLLCLSCLLSLLGLSCHSGHSNHFSHLGHFVIHMLLTD